MNHESDVLVIGAGLAGLAAGIRLARRGTRVTVLEQAELPGGACGVLGRALFPVPGPCLAGSRALPLDALLGSLDLRELELAAVEPGMALDLQSREIVLPPDPSLRADVLHAAWPAEAGIQAFLGLLEGEDEVSAPAGHPLLPVVAGRVDDAEAVAGLTAFWPCSGLPPARLSWEHYAALWRRLTQTPARVVDGGWPALLAALQEALRRNGGELVCGEAVQRIHRRGGRLLGVTTSRGRELAAGRLISTASPHETFEELLADPSQAVAGYPPLREFSTGCSLLSLQLLIEGEAGPLARTTYVHWDNDLDGSYVALQAADPEFESFVIEAAGPAEAPSLPPGHISLTAWAPFPYLRKDRWHVPIALRRRSPAEWPEAYATLCEALQARVLEALACAFPGIDDRVRASRLVTPVELESAARLTGGAWFGWAPLPEQAGRNAPGPHTTFPGLFMAGRWAAPDVTAGGLLESGVIAAAALLDSGARPSV